jgi:hypothetical protein
MRKQNDQGSLKTALCIYIDAIYLVLCKYKKIGKEDIAMKQAANFRLDETVLNTIATLAKDLRTTKTDIIEKAVAQFAATTTHKRNALMQFAGALGKNDADSILSAIQKDKNSKDIDLHL